MSRGSEVGESDELVRDGVGDPVGDPVGAEELLDEFVALHIFNLKMRSLSTDCFVASYNKLFKEQLF